MGIISLSSGVKIKNMFETTIYLEFLVETTHSIHGTNGIYIFLRVNVSKYTSPMDAMGEAFIVQNISVYWVCMLVRDVWVDVWK